MLIKMYAIICLLICSAFAWEFIGPGDSANISNLYSFGNGHILAFQQDTSILHRSRDYGDSWDTVANTGFPRLSSCHYNFIHYNTKLWGGVSNEHGLYFSSDSGNTWVKDTMIHCGGGMAYSFASKDSILLVGTYCDFARSTDYGSTWQSHIEIPDLLHDIGAVFSLMEFRDVVYAGTQYGVFASMDWGLTWEKRGVNITGQGGTIFHFGRIDTVMFFCSQAAVYRSYDLLQDGNDWIYTLDTRRETNLHVVDSSVIYVSDYDQNLATFFYSVDTGKTYVPFSVTNNDFMQCYNIRSDDKYVYVMNRKGIFRNLKTDSPTGIANKKKYNNKPLHSRSISVRNNVLHYDVKQPGPVAINIFKVNGQKVFSLYNARQQIGLLRIDLKKSHVSAGSYIFRLKTSRSLQAKMIAIE